MQADKSAVHTGRFSTRTKIADSGSKKAPPNFISSTAQGLKVATDAVAIFR